MQSVGKNNFLKGGIVGKRAVIRCGILVGYGSAVLDGQIVDYLIFQYFAGFGILYIAVDVTVFKGNGLEVCTGTERIGFDKRNGLGNKHFFQRVAVIERSCSYCFKSFGQGDFCKRLAVIEHVHAELKVIACKTLAEGNFGNALVVVEGFAGEQFNGAGNIGNSRFVDRTYHQLGKRSFVVFLVENTVVRTVIFVFGINGDFFQRVAVFEYAGTNDVLISAFTGNILAFGNFFYACNVFGDVYSYKQRAVLEGAVADGRKTFGQRDFGKCRALIEHFSSEYQRLISAFFKGNARQISTSVESLVADLRNVFAYYYRRQLFVFEYTRTYRGNGIGYLIFARNSGGEVNEVEHRLVEQDAVDGRVEVVGGIDVDAYELAASEYAVDVDNCHVGTEIKRYDITGVAGVVGVERVRLEFKRRTVAVGRYGDEVFVAAESELS